MSVRLKDDAVETPKTVVAPLFESVMPTVDVVFADRPAASVWIEPNPVLAQPMQPLPDFNVRLFVEIENPGVAIRIEPEPAAEIVTLVALAELGALMFASTEMVPGFEVLVVLSETIVAVSG